MMDASARSKVDCGGQLSCALQDLTNASSAALPHGRIHGNTREIRIDNVGNIAFDAESKGTRQTRMI